LPGSTYTLSPRWSRENLAGAVDSFGPGDLVAGGDVVVGLDGQQAVEGFPVVVDVGENASSFKLLSFAASRGASDVLLIAGHPPCCASMARWRPAPGRRSKPTTCAAWCCRCSTPPQLEELQKNRSVDFSFLREGLGRFRVNIHHQRGTLAASIRLLPSKIPTLESLHLPPHLAKLAEKRQGLVLLTGATGCGKSSTLAALIDIVNTRARRTW
jgi:twitching motility protein PilT